MSDILEAFPPFFSVKPRWMERTSRFILSKQDKNGGFIGRGEKADLYYTLFGVLCLRLLNELEKVTEKTKSFISSSRVIDNFPHLYARVVSMALLGIKQSKNEQSKLGNYVKCTISSAHKDTDLYQLFLALSTLNYLGICIERRKKNRIVKYIASCQRRDGGFTSSERCVNSTTNQTSAAIGALFMVDGLGAIDIDRVAQFYEQVRYPTGGFCASPLIRVPDLLSTYTSCLALTLLGRGKQISSQSVKKFVLSMRDKEGGFRGSAIDPMSDIEYTYYALGTLSLLQEVTERLR